MTNITILGIPITYADRENDLPYCEFIRLAERELAAVRGQIETLEDQLSVLPSFGVSKRAQDALDKAKAWYVGAVQEWAIWRDMYARIDLKGKADMTLNQLIRYHNEVVIPNYHPNAEMQATLHLAIRINGLSAEIHPVCKDGAGRSRTGQCARMAGSIKDLCSPFFSRRNRNRRY